MKSGMVNSIKTFKSFTISELLVVLIITSILSISLYYSYIALSRQLILYDRNQESLSRLDQFYARMIDDFSTSKTATLSGGMIKLTFNNKEIFYAIESSSIKRKHDSHVEEIEISLSSKEHFSEDNQIINGANRLLGSVVLDFKYMDHSFRWLLSKEYDMDTKVRFTKSN